MSAPLANSVLIRLLRDSWQDSCFRNSQCTHQTQLEAHTHLKHLGSYLFSPLRGTWLQDE